MENDVDIYADLPSFNLNPEKNDRNCNCKEFKKELNSLASKLESIQRNNTNLEKNMSSLLKTARAEIARKDKMIDDLRKRLDDVTFRRSNKSESSSFSTHRLPHQHTRKYENVSSMHSQESETEFHEIQFHYDENKSKKPQNDVNRIPTVFGERLHKRIIEDEQDAREKNQKALLKLNVEAKTKDMSKENIVENDKETGSQFSVNNNDNQSNTGQYSNSEPPYRKNLKRTNEKDDTRRHKRLKIENNEDKTTTEETDYLTRYDLTDNPAQYEMKYGLAKFEERLDAVHSLKKEEVPFYVGRRAASEHQDTKQDQSCTNGWRSEAKSNSAKDYDSSNIRNGPADSLRNSRAASTSKYKYSLPRRSYSRSRSDYESSSSHRLRERSNRTYGEKKYDDYKYDSRYKSSRLRRNYESKENDEKTRYRREERSKGLRDKSRYSSSDAEDKESSSSYKNKKYENRRIKKETANVLNNKKLHVSNKAETDFRESSSQTIVNNSINPGESITEKSAGKNIEQHEMKNESEIKSTNATKSTSARVAMENLNNLEEGEILDSPEKKINSAKISKNNKMEENNVKIVPVPENKNEDVSVNVSIDDKPIPLQNDVNNTKQLEVADISTKKVEVASHLLQENSKDCGDIIQLNSSKSYMVIDEVYNCIKNEDICKKDDNTCKSHINENLMDSTTHNIGIIERVRDSDIDGNNKNDADKTSKDSITETAIKIKEITNSNIESVTEIKELDDLSVKSITKLDNLNIENIVEITEMNNFNSSNSIHKNYGNELRTSTAEAVMRVEAVLNCDIEDRDKSHVPIGSETFQMSNKNNVEVCLNDHNYVQSSSINVSDAIQKPSLRSECDEAVPETATSKETKAEKTIKVQSVGVKRTMPSIVKNKKDQQSKGILISHRRRAVKLSDSNASMTILMNTNITKTSCVISNCNDNDSTLKPRACKISRVSAKATCK